MRGQIGAMMSKPFRVALDTAIVNAVFDAVAASFVSRVENFVLELIFEKARDLTAGEVRRETAAFIEEAFSECSKLRIFELPNDADESIFWGRLVSSIHTRANKGFCKWSVGLDNGKPFARIVGSASTSP